MRSSGLSATSGTVDVREQAPRRARAWPLPDLSGGLPLRYWEIALYAALIALAVSLRFWDLGARVLHHDESLHAGLSWQLADGRGYTHLPFLHGPFQYLATGLGFILFGDSDYTARVVPALFGSALVGLPFFLRGYLGRVGALIAALLLAVSPTLLYFSRFARNDIYIAFFTLALVACVWRYLSDRRRLYLYLTAGLLALSFATKEVTFIVVAILLVYLNLLVAHELMEQIRLLGPGGRTSGGSARRDSPSPAETHYSMLSIPEGASAKTIRRAYRRLIREPEALAEDELALIEGAYKTLSNPRRRQGYDRLLARSRKAGPEAEQEDSAEPAGAALAPQQRTVAYTALVPTAWLLAALWPLLEPLRRRFALRELPAAGHLLLLLGCLSLPQFAAGVQKLPFVGEMSGSAEDVLMRVCVVGLIIASFCVGFLWRWRVWIVSAAVFYTIFILMYTTGFANPEGFWTGIWGSLDYWLSQQDVGRGEQPAYYYFMLLPVYEFLPVIFALGGALFYAVRGEAKHRALALASLALVMFLALAGAHLPFIGEWRMQAGFVVVIATVLLIPMERFTQFLLFWALSALFALTVAGEKMPWLAVHLALPLAILAARMLGNLLEGVGARIEVPPLRRWAPFACAGLAAPLAVAIFIAVGPSGAGSLGGWLLIVLATASIAWSAYSVSPRMATQAAAVALAGGLLVFTVWTGVLASWGHPGLAQLQGGLGREDKGDTPVEMLVYTQSTPDILRIRDEIERLAAASGKGYELPVVVDSRNGFSWPWAWYLRRYTELYFGELEPGFEPVEGSVLLVNEESSANVSVDPELFSPGVPYRHRWWFPESYRGLDSLDLLRKLVDPVAWSNWRSYFIDRTPPGDFGSAQAIAYFPRDFPLSQVLSQAASPQP